jgi:predicted AlkP superfamily phosphohydrolase/phosphomutase
LSRTRGGCHPFDPPRADRRRRPAGRGRLLLVAALVMPVAGCSRQAPKAPAAAKRVFILGCDGMDPKLVRRLLDQGRLPNFARLASQGVFSPLTTSIPPQSPVAWSNFITGADPGVHGIFDFLHRDPVRPGKTYYSTNQVRAIEEKAPWRFGRYVIPRTETTNELLRRGTPFWDYLDAKGIPVQMYHLPANYPPSPSHHGHMCCLSGMGVPDALGNLGTYQHFSTLPRSEYTGPEGMKLRIRRDPKTGVYSTKIHGPTNEFLATAPRMLLDLQIHADPRNDVAKLAWVNEAVAGDQPMELLLNTGEWSDWVELHFLKTPLGPLFPTMVRFYLQRVRPEVELFMTPPNFIPERSDIVFSEPPDFAAEIAGGIGRYFTQSFAEQYNARMHRVFTDEEFRVQAGQVLDEGERMLDYALSRYRDGLLFFYFSATDLQGHIFWWDGDDKHPVRNREQARRYHGVLEGVYTRVDAALGRCLERLPPETTVLVMSDHGFCNFRRCFSLNTWLRQEGYLTAKKDIGEDADWSATRAYGLGINGLYLNLQGREPQGIVEPARRDALLKELSEKLLAVRDPVDNRPVIRRVYRTDEWYHGPETAKAPDLIIGYERDYRASWETCVGKFNTSIVFNNDEAWSADHCIAHDVVPGILLCNRPIRKADPALVDLAPTILAEFGVEKPGHMTGRSLFAPEPLAAR